MNMNDYQEALSFAEASFSNKQYPVALEYYEKALEERPDDVYALSRAGCLCVVLGEYDKAFSYFSKAIECDPLNGDNYFNLGNAYFFRQNYALCLEMYTKAESLGCSTEVLNKLYFQKAMLCSSRKDYESALMYLNKYESAMENNPNSMDPRILSEKVKLYMALNDLENALYSASKLIMIQPSVFANYLLSFNLYFTIKDYVNAEKVLADAETTAKMTKQDRYILQTVKIGFYTELVEAFVDDPDIASQSEKIAYELCQELLTDPEYEGDKREVKIQLANLYRKTKRYSDAISELKGLLPEEEIVELEKEEIDEIKKLVISRVKVTDSNYIDDSNGLVTDDGDAPVTDDGDAPVTDDGDAPVTDDGDDFVTDKFNVESAPEEPQPVQLKDTVSTHRIEQVKYLLLSCYLSADKYIESLRLSIYFKDSSNTVYRYFSRYAEAYCVRRLAQTTDLFSETQGKEKYAETIAFFRTCIMKDHKDKVAIVLRARMYAEQGLFFKAEEMAKLLGDPEHTELIKYFEECKENSNKANA